MNFEECWTAKQEGRMKGSKYLARAFWQIGRVEAAKHFEDVGMPVAARELRKLVYNQAKAAGVEAKA